jgi:hypothetical protein
LVIDAYEMLAPLDDWFRTVFLPQLRENVLLVLASSQPPLPTWRTDSGWQELIRFLPLPNLNLTENQTYLASREIPTDQQPAILDFTRGHPLALALVAGMFAQRGDISFHFEPTPNMIQTLLVRLASTMAIVSPLGRYSA